MLKRILFLIAVSLTANSLLFGQVTTSSITGIVKNNAGEALVGASIKITHVPTGSVYSTATRTGGRFDISNMNPGGPYTIVTTYIGYETDTKTEIFLSLGEAQRIDIDLGTKSTQLSEVVVASARAGGRTTGTETTISRDKMVNIPTVGRNLQDYLRATPQFKMSSAGSASSEGAMSFAGQNVRYNSFYIDGAVNNDVFGLAYSGTNGGQSGIAPISIDAIDQFQVSLSPYNTSLGNFTGAAINAITKSGTNAIHGSAYYIVRNESLSGKTPTGPKELATKLTDFTNKTYGLTLGGPIIKNKLFYFVSAELQRDNTPQPFDFSTYRGNSNAATLQRLKDTIAARLGGYDAGTYNNNETVTTSDRITAKLDWNVNPKNKLALSYRYNGGERSVIFASTPTSLTFDKNGYIFPTKTHSASAELKSTVGRNSSNRLLFTFTNVEDDRDPIGGGDAVPVVRLGDGNGTTIFFGTEANSTLNYLKQNTYNVVEHFKFNVGKNSIMVGAEAEYYKAYNLFINNSAGNYQYDDVAGGLTGIESFFNNGRPTSYVANFPLLSFTDEKNTESAAAFNIFKGALFINDEIRANKNLVLNFGIRADYNNFITKPKFDQFAIDSALPKFAQYYDLKGALPDQKPNIPLSISPRFGFTLTLPEEGLTIRGGAGLFAGRIPMVWPGGIYNNNGLSSGGYTISTSVNTAIYNQDRVRFVGTPYTPAQLGISLDNAKGQLNLISKEFKIPKVFRTSIAFDKRLGKGWKIIPL
ncbi:MAG: carboxypeptidase-like regulatory domain-containing protein [Bacteroidota bacterium]